MADITFQQFTKSSESIDLDRKFYLFYSKVSM